MHEITTYIIFLCTELDLDMTKVLQLINFDN